MPAVHTELTVFLDGTRIGTLTQSGQGSLAFSYHEAYRSTSDPTPLSLSMPLAQDRFSHKVTSAFFDGLLPDNDAVRSRWAAQYGVSARNPFALLRHVGRDAAGAVQVLPPDHDADDAAQRTGALEWLSDDDVESMLVRLSQGEPDWNPGRFAGRWSLAGGQPKVALFRDPDSGRWGVPLDSTPTTHILKPSLGQLSEHHLNEVLCLRAARELGLQAATTEVLDTARVQAVVSTRYDRHRERNTGRLSRLHQEDLCQALAVDPRQKYQSDGGPGVAQVGRLFALLDLADRRSSAERFFDALVYNVLIAGTDAHAKNYSLLMRGRRATMAPLYDLISWAPHDDDPRVTRSAMRIGDHDQLLAISERDWIKAARSLGLAADHAVTRTRELRAAAPDAFSTATAALPAPLRQRGASVADAIIAHQRRLPEPWGHGHA